MAQRQTPYEYFPIVQADEALAERMRLQRTVFQPLLDEWDQCKFFWSKLDEDKAYVQCRLYSRFLTASSIERVRNQQILGNLQDDYRIAETAERKVELAEKIREQRSHGNMVLGFLEEKLEARRLRVFAIDIQLQQLERAHPKSVADLQAERAHLEAAYYPTELLTPPAEPKKKNKKKKESKKA